MRDAETRRDRFEREVDSYCQYAVRPRPRCAEWVAFTERFLPYCEDWNGCWVAEEAIHEWNLYLSLPEGEYEPLEYPEGYHFYPEPRTAPTVLSGSGTVR